jgi:hypothetical protein
MAGARWQLPKGMAENRSVVHMNATAEGKNCILLMLALDKARGRLYNAASSGGKPSGLKQHAVESGEDRSVAV